MYNVLAYDLVSIMGDLRKSASGLQSVWNDTQYDYFVSNYVEPAESALSLGMGRIEMLLSQFNSLTTQIEGLE